MRVREFGGASIVGFGVGIRCFVAVNVAISKEDVMHLYSIDYEEEM